MGSRVVRKMMKIYERTAVVTGAGSPRGIGFGVVKRYAEEGWAVAILDLDLEGANRIAEQVTKEYGVPTLAVQVNVADEVSVDAAYKKVEESIKLGKLPPVEALANIAGIASPLEILDTSLEVWNKVMAVNATGTFLVTKAFLPGMIKQKRGAIVNMSSVSAQQGGGVFSKSAYSAAKAAILGFSRALARELGPDQITVNAIAPGAVDTDIRVGSTPEAEKAIVDSVPLGRVASVEEIANLVVFLSGDESRYITGQTIVVDGGLTSATR